MDILVLLWSQQRSTGRPLPERSSCTSHYLINDSLRLTCQQCNMLNLRQKPICRRCRPPICESCGKGGEEFVGERADILVDEFTVRQQLFTHADPMPRDLNLHSLAVGPSLVLVDRKFRSFIHSICLFVNHTAKSHML